MSKQWDEIVSALRVYGYASDVVDSPPTVFCDGDRGTAVVRPTKAGVIVMVENREDVVLTSNPGAEEILRELVVIGSPGMRLPMQWYQRAIRLYTADLHAHPAPGRRWEP